MAEFPSFFNGCLHTHTQTHTHTHTHTFEILLSFPTDICPKGGLLDHMVLLFLIFLKNLHTVLEMAISSVQFSHSIISDSLQPHGLQHARLLCPSPTPRVYSSSCPLSRWCHPTILSSVIPFSFCLQSFPVSGSFQMSQFFASDGQSIEVSVSESVLPMNIQDWFPLGLTGLISLQSKGLSRVFSSITVLY